MAFGTWRSPFPFQFGGNSTRRVTRIYDSIRGNLGSAISQESGSFADMESRAAARVLAVADRAIDRRVVQTTDPRKLTGQRLERWEAILGTVHSINDSDLVRRNRVASRLLSFYAGDSGSISKIAEESFYPWSVNAHYTPLAAAVMSWPAGSPAAPNDWYSTVAMFAVEYIKPSGATDDDAKKRREACLASLDEHVSAWATFNFHETVGTDTYHWIAGTTRCDIGVVGDP